MTLPNVFYVWSAFYQTFVISLVGLDRKEICLAKTPDATEDEIAKV